MENQKEKDLREEHIQVCQKYNSVVIVYNPEKNNQPQCPRNNTNGSDFSSQTDSGDAASKRQ